MKMNLLVSALTVSTLMTTVPMALAGSNSVSAAVTKMEIARAGLTDEVDPIVTGSVRSANEFDARGVVIANAEVTLGAGLAARIKKMPFKSGQEFKAGDELVVFDCAKQRADLRGAEASLEKATTFFAGKQRLQNRGAAGGQEVREAAADVATAKANVDGLKEVLTLCNVPAPFDGRVVERHAEAHEIPAANSPVMTVVDVSTLEIDLIVPSSWLRWVKTGSQFEFAVDELGEKFGAKVARLGAKVDAVSQTIKLTGVFTSKPQYVLTGMSGTATFLPPTN